MTGSEAIKVLTSHLRQCGMLMPTEWIDKNGSGELMDAFELAFDALQEKDATDTNDGHKWISVKERLPKHGAMAFCKTQYFYEVLQRDDHGNMWHGKDGYYSASYVTHWMPLPEPPEGGAEE